MDTPLLATKLFVPEARPGLVSRPRLMECLQGACTHAMVLVSAPPGFGKTTLLSQWVRMNHSQTRAAWVSLDEGDNSILRFWGYVIAAAQQLIPGAGEATLSMLRSTEPTTDAALNAFINDLAKAKDDVTIVLDDFHVITAEPVCSTVTYLVEHLPPNVHLVIATRADPPLSLARFRGRGMLLEIGADDLRFTDEEAAALLREGRAALASKNISALNARTEGWAVGLKLAALSLPQNGDLKSFVDSFSGSQRYVADYLVEEVLRRQPEETRDFLLKTSVLEKLTAALCEFVTERKGSQEMLVRLEGTLGGFLVALDQSRQWYRYHHLFGELLRNQLVARAPAGSVTELYLRACQWCEDSGFPGDAVNYALAARDWERAIRLISAQSGQLMAGGDMGKLIKWIGALPAEVLHARQQLQTLYAVCLLTVGLLDAARAALDDLETRARGDVSFLGRVTALQATLAARSGDYRRAIDRGERALKLLPPEDLAAISRVNFTLGVSHESLLQLDEAERYLAEAHQLGQRAGDFWASVGGAAYLAQTWWLRGKLSDAVALDERAIALAGQAPAGANAR